MTGREPSQPDLSPDSEVLVAYLDGELDPAAAQAVEDRLAAEPDLRETLQRLQQSWDLLDLLPQPATDENLTRTTVEMVALQLSEQLPAEAKSKQRQRRIFALVAAAALMITVAAGYGVTRSVLNRDNRQFLKDLPVIENVDLYQLVDDVQFLQSLAEQGLFDDDVEPSEDRDASP